MGVFTTTLTTRLSQLGKYSKYRIRIDNSHKEASTREHTVGKTWNLQQEFKKFEKSTENYFG